MKRLCLVYPEKSDIKFKISKYPDGMQDITLTGWEAKTSNEWGMPLQGPVRIESRFNNLEDLGLIICATKALRRWGIEDIDLYIPYLLGARADRQFVEGGASYLVDVIAPILNEQHFKHIIVRDVHSDVAAACIKNLYMEDNVGLVQSFLEDFIGADPGVSIDNDIVIVSPDGGSLKKIYKLVDKLGFKGKVITCSKSRDTEGKLSKVEVPLTAEIAGKDLVIIDDICDGGRTFVEIAQKIQEANLSNKVHLVVTHGIFSAGFEKLEKYFDRIYCTNSYSDLNFELGGIKSNPVKQINTFQP